MVLESQAIVSNDTKVPDLVDALNWLAVNADDHISARARVANNHELCFETIELQFQPLWQTRNPI